MSASIAAEWAEDALGVNGAAEQNLHCCFDAGRNGYWLKNARGEWISLNETQIKRELRGRRISPKVREGAYTSPLDEALLDIQHNHDVHYAGALAGYDAGIHEIGSHRILVTESPQLIEPCKGDWSLIRTVTEGLLHDPDFNQIDHFYGWLKISYEALRARELRPGQALGIVGPRNCGKSLEQNLITQMLGRRSARPYQFMSGLTPFNSDLFEAEHLMIEDEQSSFDIRIRRNFGAHLKAITVIERQRCHAKNRIPVTLTPFWRLTISVNDEPENLMVLPPIDDSIEDKLIILRASRAPMPMPTATLKQRERFWETLVSQLPAFLYFLCEWEIPRELSSERFGVKHFQHPEILRQLDDLAPEFRLRRLIDESIVHPGDEWQGSADELERKLTEKDSATQYEARRLFSFNTACGVYLGRLAKRFPERFVNKHTMRGNLWTIRGERTQEELSMKV